MGKQAGEMVEEAWSIQFITWFLHHRWYKCFYAPVPGMISTVTLPGDLIKVLLKALRVLVAPGLGTAPSTHGPQSDLQKAVVSHT